VPRISAGVDAKGANLCQIAANRTTRVVRLACAVRVGRVGPAVAGRHRAVRGPSCARRQGVRWPRPGTDPLTGLPVVTIWGRTLAGRSLIVGVYHVGGFTWKIIDAREMTANELAEFAWWEETQ
jgi:hypothetical protein